MKRHDRVIKISGKAMKPVTNKSNLRIDRAKLRGIMHTSAGLKKAPAKLKQQLSAQYLKFLEMKKSDLK